MRITGEKKRIIQGDKGRLKHKGLPTTPRCVIPLDHHPTKLYHEQKYLSATLLKRVGNHSDL